MICPSCVLSVASVSFVAERPLAFSRRAARTCPLPSNLAHFLVDDAAEGDAEGAGYLVVGAVQFVLVFGLAEVFLFRFS